MNGRPGVGATLLVLGTFVLGMIAGAALLHIVSRSIPMHPRMGPGPGGDGPPLELLKEDLGLTPDQAEKLREILDETHTRIRAEVDGTRDRIREILDPEQLERFEAMHPGHLGPHGPVRRRRPG
jgi:hypothetical protein